MPNVTDEFIKQAELLAQAAKTPVEKSASASIKSAAELTATTLVSQGLVKEADKSSAIASLMDHEDAINALNQIAQLKTAAPKKLDTSELVAPIGKSASMSEYSVKEETMPESDKVFLQRLFGV